jgi:hypothetical protein
MQDRDTLRRLLRDKHVPGYDKEVKFSTYSAGYHQAVKRAERMDTSAETEGDAGRNPSTGVYKLTEIIREK